MSNETATISAAIPSNVKAEVAAVAAAHGMSLVTLMWNLARLESNRAQCDPIVSARRVPVVS